MTKQTHGYNIYLAHLGTKHQGGSVGCVGYERATSARAAVKKAKAESTNRNLRAAIGKRRYRIYAELA